MKINVDQRVLSIDGKPLKIPTDDTPKDATLADLCTMALLAERPDIRLSAPEKLERWKLAKRLHVGGEIDLSAQDRTKLMEICGSFWSPGWYGPVHDLLEDKADDKKE